MISTCDKKIKISRRPTRAKIVRERRRLKKFVDLVAEGRMTELEVHNAYKAWRQATLKDCPQSRTSVYAMDKLYDDLFPIHEVYIKSNRRNVTNQIWSENALDYILASKYI